MKCNSCQNDNAIWRCSGCVNTFYCNEDCQQSDWSSHQLVCGVVDAIGERNHYNQVPNINNERYLSLKFRVNVDLHAHAKTTDSANRIYRITQIHPVKFHTAVATSALCRLFITRPELKLVLEPNDITFLYCPGQETKYVLHYFQIWLKKYESPILLHYNKIARVIYTNVDDIKNKLPNVPKIL